MCEATTATADGPGERKQSFYRLVWRDGVNPMALQGTIIPQYVKCGKRGCRCEHGVLHGPYTYHLWEERGRTRKRYVRPEDAEIAKAMIDRRRDNQRVRRDAELERALAWRDLKAAVRRGRLETALLFRQVRELIQLQKAWTKAGLM